MVYGSGCSNMWYRIGGKRLLGPVVHASNTFVECLNSERVDGNMTTVRCNVKVEVDLLSGVYWAILLDTARMTDTYKSKFTNCIYAAT
jgi:hypothetical protein